MQDYEKAAFESVERLKEKHLQEVKELKEKVRSEFTVKFKWSRELMDLRRQERVMFSVKDYEGAEENKAKGDKMEAKERGESEK